MRSVCIVGDAYKVWPVPRGYLVTCHHRRYARRFMSEKASARFIEPMLLLRTEKLPDGPGWLHELKFDGYRALAIKSGGKIHLRSRNDNDFNGRYTAIVKALGAMPEDTVIDGEVVALDGDGKPSFNLLQNYAAGADLHFFIFDVLILKEHPSQPEECLEQRLVRPTYHCRLEDKVALIFHRRVNRCTRGRFRTRVVTKGGQSYLVLLLRVLS